MNRDRSPVNRRRFLVLGSAAAAATLVVPAQASAPPKVRVTGFELLPIRATERTVWLVVRLKTDVGLIGLGEASDAFGFANTTKQDANRMEAELRAFFGLIQGRSPLDLASFRLQGEQRAERGGLIAATAFSAIEQALWDLSGKALDVPTYTLLGGRLRDVLPVYANINRATKSRTPSGFAATARAAVREGFQAVKAAPFDGFPPPGSAASSIAAAVENGISCVAAMREAIGPQKQLMVDCHSFFDVALAERVAQRLEPHALAWYEEPVPPERINETREIRRRIRQPMAGGELLFGVRGFAALSRDRTVDVIMPDVKHCGGLQELTRIAAIAEPDGVQVAPHNPSGPVSTAASAQVCAVIRNFKLLELQWGEVPWRADLVSPVERFDNGSMHLTENSGLGIELNESVARAHPI
jgi:galactonate dehydratase